jgi:nucleotide-binding universal stress UspA family protein
MYKKIMVPLDGSVLAECVLPHVDGFVSGCQVETVIFVRVVEPTHYSVISPTANPQFSKTLQENAKMMEEDEKSSAETYLKGVISRVKQCGLKYKTDVLVGAVAESLADYIDANEIDLVLIATHGRSGISRWVRGSIADRVLRSSSAPVLMVRAGKDISGARV